MVVAIDGPAGAGKSTVARALARALGFTYLDSGAMYRTVGLVTLREGGAASDRAEQLELELGDRVIANGEDVTEAIRAPEVTEAASRVATNPKVRAALVRKQRELLDGGDWVAEGRDIGTVVAPDAEVKVFLTASPEERARRRARELGADPDTVLRDQALRDAQDSSREHSPLERAPGAIELDTSGLSLEQVVERIVGLVEAAQTRGDPGTSGQVARNHQESPGTSGQSARNNQPSPGTSGQGARNHEGSPGTSGRGTQPDPSGGPGA